MKPAAIAGEAVFTSYDGLRVEANGVLGFLTFERQPLEMRSDLILAGLMPTTSSDCSLFMQKLIVEGQHHWLIGLVRKIKDYNGRPGVIGACVGLQSGSTSSEGVEEYLHDILFPIVETATFDQWAGRPLPERLNILSDVPKQEKSVEYQFIAGTMLLHIVDGNEVELHEVKQASFDLILLSKTIGRVVLVPKQTTGTHPADRQFLDKVQTAVDQAVANAEQSVMSGQAAMRDLEAEPTSGDEIVRRLIKQEVSTASAEVAIGGRIKKAQAKNVVQKPRSLEEVLRRQEILDHRLTRIEQTLKMGAQSQRSKVMPIDQAFARNITKPDIQTKLILAFMSVLAFVLVVLFIVWLSGLTSVGEEEAPQLSEALPEVAVQGAVAE